MPAPQTSEPLIFKGRGTVADEETCYEDMSMPIQSRRGECQQDPWERLPGKGQIHPDFIIGDWNAKVGSQETPGVTGKFGLGIQNEAGQRQIEFYQENALVF